jgi:hypothetical protein
MKILQRLRNGSVRGGAGGPGSAEATSADERRLPIARIRSDPPAARVGLDGPPAMKSRSHHSSFDRVDTARDERNERERLRDEARYRRERLELFRARLYGGRPASQGRLRELQRASDGATARLRRAEAAAPPAHPPT